MLVIIAWALIIIGVFSVISGVMGLYRMPDFYSKIHAAGVIDCFGVPSCIIGLAMLNTSYIMSFKLIFIALLIIALSPVSTHALGKAALLQKITTKNYTGNKI